MKQTTTCFSLAILLALGAFARADDNGLPRTAFVMEGRVAGLGSLGTGGLTSTAVPSILFGARLVGRIQVGLGFGVLHLSNQMIGEFGGTAGDVTDVTFAPTAAFDLVKSPDQRVSFYLKTGLPLGPTHTCATPIRTPLPGQPVVPAATQCDDSFFIGFDAAIGARFAIRRVIAVGLEAGAEGIFTNPQRNDTQGTIAFYGALVGSFYVGH